MKKLFTLLLALLLLVGCGGGQGDDTGDTDTDKTVTVVSSTMSPSVLGSLIKKLGPKKTILIGAILFGIGYIRS